MAANRDTQRIDANEAAFREINEAIGQAAARYGGEGHRYQFLCECRDLTCFRTIELTLPEYQNVRKKRRRFVLLRGHADPRVERVIEKHDEYEIVETIARPDSSSWRG